MLKKIIFIWFCIVGFSMALNAQYYRRVATYPTWYIGADTGVNWFLGEGNNPMKSSNYFSVIQNAGLMERVSVGYNMNPIIGFRSFLGLTLHSWPDVRVKNTDNTYLIRTFQAENLTVDLMVNLTNLVGTFNRHRIFELFAFGGGGIANRDRAVLVDANMNNAYDPIITMIGRAGLQGNFRLSSELDLNFLVEGNLVNDNYNGYVYGLPVDLYGGLTVGVSYHFVTDRMKTWKIPVHKRRRY